MRVTTTVDCSQQSTSPLTYYTETHEQYLQEQQRKRCWHDEDANCPRLRYKFWNDTGGFERTHNVAWISL